MVRAVEVAAGCLRLTVENSGPPLAEDGPSASLRAVLPRGPGPCSRDRDRARARGRGRSDEPAWRLDPGGGSGDDRGGRRGRVWSTLRRVLNPVVPLG